MLAKARRENIFLPHFKEAESNKSLEEGGKLAVWLKAGKPLDFSGKEERVLSPSSCCQVPKRERASSPSTGSAEGGLEKAQLLQQYPAGQRPKSQPLASRGEIPLNSHHHSANSSGAPPWSQSDSSHGTCSARTSDTCPS